MRATAFALMAALAATPALAQEETVPVLPEAGSGVEAPIAGGEDPAGFDAPIASTPDMPVEEDLPPADDLPMEPVEAEPAQEPVMAEEPVQEEAAEEAVPAEDGAVDSTEPAAPVEPETLPAEAVHGRYEEIGTAGDWTAIRFQPVEDRTVCAIFSRPTDSIITENGNAIDALRGERAAFITWESGTVVDAEGVFSAIMGAPLASPFEGHSFKTEKGEFKMFGHDDRLYTEAQADAEAIAAIRSGLTLTLTATLPGNRVAQDTYSLRGVQASTNLAREACPAAG